MKIPDRPKPHILKEALCENNIFTLVALSFWHRISIQISCFFRTGSWTYLFLIFPEFYRKSEILAPLLDPMGPQMATKISIIPEK